MSSSEFSLNARPRATSRARTSSKPVPLNAMWSTGPVEGARVETGMPTFFVHAEHVAVEIPRSLDVVAEHEVVLETLQRHHAPRIGQAVYRIPRTPCRTVPRAGLNPFRSALSHCDAGPLAHRFVPRLVMSWVAARAAPTRPTARARFDFQDNEEGV
jgi:hypothetical protein